MDSADNTDWGKTSEITFLLNPISSHPHHQLSAVKCIFAAFGFVISQLFNSPSDWWTKFSVAVTIALMFSLLESPDSHFLQAARGWLELGNWREARTELDRIRPSHRGHPEVLKLRWEIHVRAGEYAACLPIAMSLRAQVPNDPLGWKLHARCFYFMQRYDAAAAVLHPALAKFPNSFEIHYDAACYACLTGDLVIAKSLLDRAFALDPRPESMQKALADVNFQRLWPELGAG